MIALKDIKVTKTQQSRLNTLDFDNIPFGRVFSDHMFIMEYNDGAWMQPEIKPVSKLEVHPSNMAWHYGQSIFEGMKAFKNKDGRPTLFRPEDHAKRFNRSAERMAMPKVDESLFVEAVRTLVGIDQSWIPTAEGSSLYIRPVMFASDEFLGVAPSESYKFIILTLPVGPYYDRPVSLYADPMHVRAVPGGVGEAKTCGNYAASLLPSRLAKQKGFDQVLWLDAVKHEYIQEVGTMNIFFVFTDEIVTPKLDGAVLQGITRDSFLTLLNRNGVKWSERSLSINEVIKRHSAGELLEVFGAGTAAVATVVSKIAYKDITMDLDLSQVKWANILKQQIHDIRSGSEVDSLGWMVEALEVE